MVNKEDAHISEIGDPPSFNMLWDSYNKLKYGRVAPAVGKVNSVTFTQLYDAERLIGGYRGLRFADAVLREDDAVPRGFVR